LSDDIPGTHPRPSSVSIECHAQFTILASLRVPGSGDLQHAAKTT